MKRVMVFGVFDGLHKGHDYVLKNAKEKGDELIVIIARDNVVRAIKNKIPHMSEDNRLAAVKAHPCVTEAALGDPEMSTYHVIKKFQPDMICLGYDQAELREDLSQYIAHNNLAITLIKLNAHKPDVFKSSLLMGHYDDNVNKDYILS